MKRKIIRIVIVCLIITIFFSVIPKKNVSASFPNKTITSNKSDDYKFIITYLSAFCSSDIMYKIQYLIEDSQYAAFSKRVFPYTNSGSFTYNVYDKNDPFGNYYYKINGGTGCWAYSYFVESFMYGSEGKSAHPNKKIKVSNMPGKNLTEKFAYFIQHYAQPGEHIRVDNYHSVSFVACDNNGFYYLNYWGSSEPHSIKLHYSTWVSFCSYYSTYYTYLYDCDTRINKYELKNVFIDYNFRNYIKEKVLNNINISDSTSIAGYIDKIYKFHVMDISYLGIKDIKGIEYFKTLTDLNCSNNFLTAIDISANPLLINVNCSANSIFYIDTSSNYLLKQIEYGRQIIYVNATQLSDINYYFVLPNIKTENISNLKGAILFNGGFKLNEKSELPCIVSFNYSTDNAIKPLEIYIKVNYNHAILKKSK